MPSGMGRLAGSAKHRAGRLALERGEALGFGFLAVLCGGAGLPILTTGRRYVVCGGQAEQAQKAKLGMGRSSVMGLTLLQQRRQSTSGSVASPD